MTDLFSKILAGLVLVALAVIIVVAAIVVVHALWQLT